MKRYAFTVVRCYRKVFSIFATKHPDLSVDYWYNCKNKIEGVIAMLRYDNTISVNEHMLIIRYFNKKMDDLYDIYCK